MRIPSPRLGRHLPHGLPLLAGLVLLFAPLSAGEVAGEGLSFAVSPSRLVFPAVPGQTSIQTLTVYNQLDTPLEISLGVGDFLLHEDGGPAETFAVTGWVRTSSSMVKLGPRESTPVTVYVDVPPGAAPGGYQAGLYLASAPTGVGEVTISGRLGTVLLIELPPEGRELRREIQVIDKELAAEFPEGLTWDSLFTPRARAATIVANVGETFVRAVAMDSYRWWTSATPEDRTAAGLTVLRGATARFATDGPALPWFGPASVTTEIVYERGAQDYATIVVQSDTFVIPWRLLILLGALAIGLALSRWVVLRRRSRVPG